MVSLHTHGYSTNLWVCASRPKLGDFVTLGLASFDKCIHQRRRQRKMKTVKICELSATVNRVPGSMGCSELNSVNKNNTTDCTHLILMLIVERNVFFCHFVRFSNDRCILYRAIWGPLGRNFYHLISTVGELTRQVFLINCIHILLTYSYFLAFDTEWVVWIRNW